MKILIDLEDLSAETSRQIDALIHTSTFDSLGLTIDPSDHPSSVTHTVSIRSPQQLHDFVTCLLLAERLSSLLGRCLSPQAPHMFLSPLQITDRCVQMLISEGLIRQKQDLCYLYRLDSEVGCVGFTSVPDFLDRLPQICQHSDLTALMPNANNFKKMCWGKRPFPDWPWDMIAEATQPHIKALCWAYIHFMKSQGYSHPNCPD